MSQKITRADLRSQEGDAPFYVTNRKCPLNREGEGCSNFLADQERVRVKLVFVGKGHHMIFLYVRLVFQPPPPSLLIIIEQLLIKLSLLGHLYF